MLHCESKSLLADIKHDINHKDCYIHTVCDNGSGDFVFMMMRERIRFRVVIMRLTGCEKVLDRLVDEVWFGSGSYDNVDDRRYEHFDCNTVLFRDGQTCFWLGAGLHTFELEKGDELTKFRSTVQNSCVPYGWIDTTSVSGD